MTSQLKRVERKPSGLDYWSQKISSLSNDAASDTDWGFLDSLADDSIKDEFVRLPYEEIAPRSSYNAEP